MNRNYANGRQSFHRYTPFEKLICHTTLNSPAISFKSHERIISTYASVHLVYYITADQTRLHSSRPARKCNFHQPARNGLRKFSPRIRPTRRCTQKQPASAARGAIYRCMILSRARTHRPCVVALT